MIRRHRQGSMSTTVATMLPVLLGFTSMGVDWGRVSVAQFATRAVADEAALAAATALSDSPTTPEEIEAAYALATSRASVYAAAMSVDDLTFTVQAVTFGYYDRTAGTGFTTTIPDGEAANAVQVRVTSNVDLAFAGLFGVDNVVVGKSSRAGASVIPGRGPDLVIAQDVTPSMSATDIANSKLANEALVSCIEENSSPETRGAYVKFANIDKTVMTLKSYEESPGELYDVVSAASPTTSYSNVGICVGGGCTSHSAGLYSAVDILDDASEPPDGVDQVIVMITDGAPYTNNSGCSSVASSSGTATDYQKWMVGTFSQRCGQLTAQTTQTACNNVGGRWVNTSGSTWKCLPSDNGAEGTSSKGPGSCSLGSTYTTEARCEGAGGSWNRTGTSTPNPSSMTKWTDDARAWAETGVWGPIDVYVVYYSAGAGTTYKNDNIQFLTDHVVSGKGAEIGVLDAPTGDDLLDTLSNLCKVYTVGTPGLID